MPDWLADRVDLVTRPGSWNIFSRASIAHEREPQMPYPENNLLRRRHRQIFIEEPPEVEYDPINDGWLAGFIARLVRAVRNIGGRK